jgi:hypothetical protein
LCPGRSDGLGGGITVALRNLVLEQARALEEQARELAALRHEQARALEEQTRALEEQTRAQADFRHEQSLLPQRVVELQESRNASISFSKVNDTQLGALLGELRMNTRIERYVKWPAPEGRPSTFPTSSSLYEWSVAKEDAQSGDALESVISALRDRDVDVRVGVFAGNDDSAPTFQMIHQSPKLQRQFECGVFSGNVDGVVVPRGCTLDGLWCARVLVELKKPTADWRQAQRQAQTQLILATLHSDYTPICLLTDLNERFEVFSLGIHNDTISVVSDHGASVLDVMDYVAWCLMRPRAADPYFVPAREKKELDNDGSPVGSRSVRLPRDGNGGAGPTGESAGGISGVGGGGDTSVSGPSECVAVVAEPCGARSLGWVLRAAAPPTGVLEALQEIYEKADDLELTGLEHMAFVRYHVLSAS